MVRQTLDVELQAGNHQSEDVSNRWKKGGDAVTPDYLESYSVAFTPEPISPILSSSRTSSSVNGAPEPSISVASVPQATRNNVRTVENAVGVARINWNDQQKRIFSKEEKQIAQNNEQALLSGNRESAGIHENEGGETLRENEKRENRPNDDDDVGKPLSSKTRIQFLNPNLHSLPLPLEAPPPLEARSSKVTLIRDSDALPKKGAQNSAEIEELVPELVRGDVPVAAARKPLRESSASTAARKPRGTDCGGDEFCTFRAEDPPLAVSTAVTTEAARPAAGSFGDPPTEELLKAADDGDKSCRVATSDNARKAEDDGRTIRSAGGAGTGANAGTTGYAGADGDAAERGAAQGGAAGEVLAAESGGAVEGGAVEGDSTAAEIGEAEGGAEGGGSWWERVTRGRIGKRRVSTEVSPPRGSSSLETVFNGVNVLTGIGILTTPYALSQAGWLALLLLPLTSLLYLLTARFLRSCMDHTPTTGPHTPITTYPDIGAAAFGRIGGILTSLLLYGELFAVSIELLILEGDSLAYLFPSFASNGVHIGPSLHLSPNQIFLIVAALIVLPTVFLRSMSLLAYVSVGGFLAALVTVVGVAWVAAVGSDDGNPTASAATTSAAAAAAASAGAAVHGSAALLRLPGVPGALGIFGFCFSGHAVFPTIYRSMDKPQHYNRVLIICFCLCTCIYGGIAILGYSMYGDATAAQITLNLPPSLIPSRVVLWTTIISPITKFAITITPVAVAIESFLSSFLDKWSPPSLASCTPYCMTQFTHRACNCTPHPLSWVTKCGVSGKTAASLAIRTLLVVLAALAGLLLPFFALMMTLIGSVLSISISLLLPTACHLSIKWRQLSRVSVVCHVAILVGGTATAVMGTVYAVKGIAAGGGSH